MIEFPPVTHKLPTVFADKIKLDRQLAEMHAAPVFRIAEWKALKDEIRLTRYSCEKHIQIQRGGTGGARG